MLFRTLINKVDVFILFLAVQCERKPVEAATREKPLNCAASTEKIYIRKNLCSPLAATPTFVTDKETARCDYLSGLPVK